MPGLSSNTPAATSVEYISIISIHVEVLQHSCSHHAVISMSLSFAAYSWCILSRSFMLVLLLGFIARTCIIDCFNFRAETCGSRFISKDLCSVARLALAVKGGYTTFQCLPSITVNFGILRISCCHMGCLFHSTCMSYPLFFCLFSFCLLVNTWLFIEVAQGHSRLGRSSISHLKTCSARFYVWRKST